MKFSNKKGFTLIELLVVIAIIGILSALIIVSMSTAQNSAKDARIKAAMDQMRSAAAQYYNANSTYGSDDVVTTDTNFVGNATYGGATLYADMLTQQATAGVLYRSATQYCFSKALATTGTFVCIGNAGKMGTVACAAVTTCN
jgi:prepilin-type N-terminal cleavage/methylation domain-containing protein